MNKLSHTNNPQNASLSNSDFPLLNPPPLPSLADRARDRPKLDTATDFTNSAYDAPLGPPPPPSHLAPRLRSAHFAAAVEADKLRAADPERAAGLRHGVVALLGLEGARVAGNVQRALAGEMFGGQDVPAVPSGMVEGSRVGSKRRRSSAAAEVSGGKRAKEGSGSPPPNKPVPVAAALRASNALPNPFSLPNPFEIGSVTTQPAPRTESDSAEQALPILPALPAATQTPPPVPAALARAPPSPATNPATSTTLTGLPGHGQPVADVEMNVAASQPGSVALEPKPKTRRPKALPTGTVPIPHIPRHSDGTPALPLQIGIMTLHQLGQVDSRDKFHTERYLFTPGYEAVRRYPSMVDPDNEVDYVCRIADNGDGTPRFDLLPADQPGMTLSGPSPTGAWGQVIKVVNALRNRNHAMSVSGPDYFGFSHAVARALIQELPGAGEVEGYVWQQFVEEGDGGGAGLAKVGGPKTAAVVTVVDPYALPLAV